MDEHAERQKCGMPQDDNAVKKERRNCDRAYLEVPWTLVGTLSPTKSGHRNTGVGATSRNYHTSLPLEALR